MTFGIKMESDAGVEIYNEFQALPLHSLGELEYIGAITYHFTTYAGHVYPPNYERMSWTEYNQDYKNWYLSAYGINISSQQSLPIGIRTRTELVVYWKFNNSALAVKNAIGATVPICVIAQKGLPTRWKLTKLYSSFYVASLNQWVVAAKFQTGLVGDGYLPVSGISDFPTVVGRLYTHKIAPAKSNATYGARLNGAPYQWSFQTLFDTGWPQGTIFTVVGKSNQQYGLGDTVSVSRGNACIWGKHEVGYRIDGPPIGTVTQHYSYTTYTFTQNIYDLYYRYFVKSETSDLVYSVEEIWLDATLTPDYLPSDLSADLPASQRFLLII